MPPRRAAATKSAAATAASAKPKPAPKASTSKKRSAPSPADDADDGADDDDKSEDDKPPKKKRAKKSTLDTAPTRTSARQKTAAAAPPANDSGADDAEQDNEDDDDDDKRKKKSTSKAATKPVSKAITPPPKMVTVLKRGKGAAPVDTISGCVSTHQVLVQGEEVYDAMLQQTDIKKNANKFYVIQLLHPIGNENNLIMFTRWGRTGEAGQTAKKGPMATSGAIAEFHKQFKAKTAANWQDRRTMVRKNGKYHWIERDFSDDDEDKGKDDAEVDEEDGGEDVKGKGKEKVAPKTPECAAAPEVQNLVKLIFNTQVMDAHLAELHYDANKLPLGKLSKATILQGFSVLKTLSEIINAPNGAAAQERGGFVSACDELSGDYYSIIPHLFNRSQRPIPINTADQLKKELDLVDALGDMTIATKLLQSSTTTGDDGNLIHPIDARLNGLNLRTIEPLAPESKEFKALEAYAKDSHGATHEHLKGATVQDIFRVERNGEEDRYLGAGYDKLDDGNRMLLWHGSRTTNFGGILSQGLRIAPPEAPVSGYMFGKGVYFADASSKSLGYTYWQLSNNTGLLLLCEVAIKPMIELEHAAYDADAKCKQAKALATKGVGTYQPSEWKDVADVTGNNELRGVIMPVGQLVEVQRKGLLYNEYIVYDTTQVRLRYLLRVSFDDSSRW